MNPRSTFILLGLFAVALAVAMILPATGLIRRSDGTNTHGRETQSASLLSADELGLSLKRIRVHLGPPGPDAIELERQGGRWWVTKPNRFVAHPPAINELLDLLAEMTGHPTDLPAGPAPEGPSISLNFGDHETDLYVSTRSGAGRAVITIRKDGKTQNLLSQDTLIDFLDQFDSAHFYARKIEIPLMPEVERIAFTTPEGGSSLVQRDGRWFIGEENNAERALAQTTLGYPGVDEVFKLLSVIELVQLQDADTPLTAFGLDRSIASVKIESPQGTLEIRIGVPADPEDTIRYLSINYADEDRPAVFTAATSYALLLGQAATSFRDPRIMATPSSLVGSMHVISAAGQTRTLSAELARQVLQQLDQARAREYIPAQADSWQKIASVRIDPELGGEPESFTLYDDPQRDPATETVLVIRGDEPVALRFDLTSVAGLIDVITLPTE